MRVRASAAVARRKRQLGAAAACALLGLGCFGPFAPRAQAASPLAFSSVSFSLEPRDPKAAAYEIRLDAKGTGTYAGGVAGAPGAPVPVHAGAATMARIAAGLGRVEKGNCETHEKHIAQTGMKTMAVETAAGTARCTFNFSDDSKLMDTTAAFQGMAETMQAGERLARLHRFDRLGLDAEMESLSQAIADGRALEPENIAPVLQELAGDEHVIDRVRRRAQRLLNQTSGADAGSSPR